MTRIEIDITPEKWPGANDAERKIAKDKAFAGNEELVGAANELTAIKTQLLMLDAQVEYLKDEFDAHQWTIRDNSNVLLGGASVFQQYMDEAIAVSMDIEAEEFKADDIDGALAALIESEQANFDVIGDILDRIEGLRSTNQTDPPAASDPGELPF